MIDRYRLQRPDSGADAWHDAEDNGGQPVEIKGALHRRSDGSAGRFRLFREPHRQLVRAGGRYVFAVYRQRGTGVELLRTRRLPATELEIERWGPSGHRHRGQQAKLPISELF